MTFFSNCSRGITFGAWHLSPPPFQKTFFLNLMFFFLFAEQHPLPHLSSPKSSSQSFASPPPPDPAPPRNSVFLFSTPAGLIKLQQHSYGSNFPRVTRLPNSYFSLPPVFPSQSSAPPMVAWNQKPPPHPPQTTYFLGPVEPSSPADR